MKVNRLIREKPGYQYCTAIPVGTLLAQTWDTELIEEIGEMIGGEMEEFSCNIMAGSGYEYPSVIHSADVTLSIILKIRLLQEKLRQP